MLVFFRIFCLGFLALSFYSTTQAQTKTQTGIFLTPSHIYLIEADEEFIWGTYYFAVSNKESKPMNLRSQVLLPLETSDYSPQSGLTTADIKLSNDKKIFVEKEFPPGLTLLSVNFKVKSLTRDQGISLTFVPPFDLSLFSIASSKKSGLRLASPALKDGLHPMLTEGEYVGLLGNQLEHGKSFSIQVSGFPESSRLLLWIMGGCTAFFMFLMAFIGTLKARPRPREVTT